MKKVARRFVFVIAALATMACGVSARAADVAASRVDWVELLDHGSKALLSGVAESPQASPSSTVPPGDTETPHAQPLVVLVPRAAVLVRDWRGSMRLAGPTTVTDELRPSASYRMAVTRVSSSGRLAPYVQIG